MLHYTGVKLNVCSRGQWVKVHRCALTSSDSRMLQKPNLNTCFEGKQVWSCAVYGGCFSQLNKASSQPARNRNYVMIKSFILRNITAGIEIANLLKWLNFLLKVQNYCQERRGPCGPQMNHKFRNIFNYFCWILNQNPLTAALMLSPKHVFFVCFFCFPFFLWIKKKHSLGSQRGEASQYLWTVVLTVRLLSPVGLQKD